MHTVFLAAPLVKTQAGHSPNVPNNWLVKVTWLSQTMEHYAIMDSSIHKMSQNVEWTMRYPKDVSFLYLSFQFFTSCLVCDKCMYVCSHVYREPWWSLHIQVAHICGSPRLMVGSCSIILPLHSLGQGSSIKPRANWCSLSNQPALQFCLYLPSEELHGFWGSKLQPLALTSTIFPSPKCVSFFK